jgi:hypothetical protein
MKILFYLPAKQARERTQKKEKAEERFRALRAPFRGQNFLNHRNRQFGLISTNQFELLERAGCERA